MAINNIVKMDALEIADEVLELTKDAGPVGLRFVDACRELDMDYDKFYQAAHELSRLGTIKIGRGADGHRNRIILPDAIEPEDLWLSDGQRRVLGYLHSQADENGLVQTSFKEIAKATGLVCPSFCIDRLDVKGYLDRTCLGGPKSAATYRVYPEGTGSRSDTWWLLKYGRLPAHELAEYRLKERQNG